MYVYVYVYVYVPSLSFSLVTCVAGSDTWVMLLFHVVACFFSVLAPLCPNVCFPVFFQSVTRCDFSRVAGVLLSPELAVVLFCSRDSPLILLQFLGLNQGERLSLLVLVATLRVVRLFLGKEPCRLVVTQGSACSACAPCFRHSRRAGLHSTSTLARVRAFRPRGTSAKRHSLSRC